MKTVALHENNVTVLLHSLNIEDFERRSLICDELGNKTVKLSCTNIVMMMVAVVGLDVRMSAMNG